MRNPILAATLVALGCTQMVADVAGWSRLRALAAAMQVSPAMKVFTSHDGYETFSPRFSIHYRDVAGRTVVVPLTPSNYRGLAGPYNRRNAYGAALAYAPVLAADDRARGMLNSIMRYGFCDPGPLVAELGLDALARVHPVSVEIEPRLPPGFAHPLRFEVTCDVE